jgi:hypothetical protein
MARRPNYGVEKRQKELKKQKKQEEKAEKKRLKREGITGDSEPQADGDSGETDRATDSDRTAHW